MRRESTRGATTMFARAAVAAIVLPLAVMAIACTSDTTTGGSPQPVRIGAIYDLSGAEAHRDAPSLEGARLAVDRINAQGGVLGRRVELLERDGQTSKNGARLAAASLVASGCSVIIGLSDPDQVLAAATVAAAGGVPFVTSGASSPRLAEQVPHWLFLAGSGDNGQAAACAQYATDQLAARTAVVLYEKDQAQAMRPLADYFAGSFKEQGGTVLATTDLTSAAKAMSAPKHSEKSAAAAGAAGSAVTLARRLAKADVVFVAAPEGEAPTSVRELRRLHLRQPLIGADGFDTSQLVRTAEQTGGKVYYTTSAAVDASLAGRAMRRFKADYEATYGLLPQNAFAALGYDAVGLVASAMRRARSVQPVKVRDALLATHRYAGVTGTLSYRGEDHVPSKRVTVVCIGRRPVVVAQFTPRFVPTP